MVFEYLCYWDRRLDTRKFSFLIWFHCIFLKWLSIFVLCRLPAWKLRWMFSFGRIESIGREHDDPYDV